MASSFRARVDAMCKGCIYDSAEPGTWRQQTEGCEIRSCPLWEVRPVSSTGKRRRARPSICEGDAALV